MSVESNITENLDIWTSAIKTKSATGRGGSKKHELYGIKKLRELILDLALRGKLVPQNSVTESARDILEKIQIEKAQLIKDKKIKKTKALDVLGDDDLPYRLPESWQWTLLNDVSTVITDGVHHTPKYIEEGVPFISVKDIDGKKVNFEACKFISKEQHEEINKRCNPQKGDILICRIGTLGRATIVDTTQPFSLFVSVGLIKFFQKYILPDYLHVVLHSPLLVAQYDEIKAGGSHTNKLNLGDIPRLKIPLAPLSEQIAIVAEVKRLMDLCDQLESQTESSIEAHQTLVKSLLETLINAKDADELNDSWQRISEHFDALFTTEDSIDQLKQTILQLAVMGKLVKQDPNDEPASKLLERIAAEKEQLIKDKKIKKQKALASISDSEKEFELPKGWAWCRLADAIDVRDGTHDSPKDAIGENTYPLVTSKDFDNGNIDFESARRISEKDHFEINKRSFVEVEDILFSMIGGNIGNQVMVLDPRPFSIKNVALFKYFTKNATNPKYVKIFTANLAHTLQSEASGGAQPFVSLGKLRSLVFALPPVNEQLRIVSKVEQLELLCDSLTSQLRDLNKTCSELSDAICSTKCS